VKREEEAITTCSVVVLRTSRVSRVRKRTTQKIQIRSRERDGALWQQLNTIQREYQHPLNHTVDR
jgi:hypothetical protein